MPKSRSAITEAKLRKLIRDELAREHLMNEGILDEGLIDSLKAPFKKLGDKAKKAIAEKADQLLEKLKGSLQKLRELHEKSNPVLKFLEKQEGGASLKDIVSQSPLLSDATSALATVNKGNVSKLAKSGASVKESFSLEEFKMFFILSEEEALQKSERASLNEQLLVEFVDPISVWVSSIKIFVGICGIFEFGFKLSAKLAKMLGLEGLHDLFEKAEHAVEKIEKFITDKILFPLPLQYAAYRAFMLTMSLDNKLDKAAQEAIPTFKEKREKAKNAPEKEGRIEKFLQKKGRQVDALMAASEKPLSFEEFKNDRETRDAALKAFKFVVVVAILWEAADEVLESVHEFLSAAKEVGVSVSDVAHTAGHVVGHASKEAGEIANLGKTVAAGEEALSTLART